MYCNKCGNKLLISVISVAVLLISAAVIYFAFFRNTGALLSLNKAIINLSVEAIERVDNTPLKAAAMLPEVLEDGTVTADFTYSNPMLDSWLSTDISGNFILSSDTKIRNFALEAQLNIFGGNYDIDAYMNKERIAVRLQLLGDSFYGLKYDTFREDIRVFGRLLRLSDKDMDAYADIIDRISTIINTEKTDDDAFDAYTEAFKGFFKMLDITSGRRHRGFNDSRVNRFIKANITADALIVLFNDIYNILENDEDMQKQLDMYRSVILPFILENDDDAFNLSLEGLRNYINDFEKNYSGDINIFFYIGAGDRLLRIIINADIEYDGEFSEFGSTLDFGDSITDDWTFSSWVINNNNTDAYFIKWSYEEEAGTYINTVQVTAVDADFITLASEWNEATGSFKLSYEDGYEQNNLTGSFTSNESSFRLSLDDIFPAGSGNNFTVSLLAEPGAQIVDIDFINVDRWGYALIESVIRLLIGMIF